MENKEYIYIAGAHSRARTLRCYLEFLNPDIKVIAFLVDDMYENHVSEDGIPVRLITNDLNIKCRVYIGTRGVNHDKIAKELQKVGFTDIVPLTVELDRKLRNEYVKRFYEHNGETFFLLNEYPKVWKRDLQVIHQKNSRKGSAKVYVASSAYDKALEELYDLAEYEKRIQVGAALTDQRLESAVYDDIGDNISEKNRQYCELTGLYWIWKHAAEDYVGLCHYRRHFILPDHWVERMEQNSIDVILPVPLYVAPNLEDNFRGRHAAREWDCMMQYLQSKLPGDYERAREFFQGNLYSPCNMLIAQRQVLDELCAWLFPILDAVVKECGTEEDKYENRYPGFLSERLITYYFESKRQQYKIAYADKNFLK